MKMRMKMSYTSRYFDLLSITFKSFAHIEPKNTEE